MKTKQSRNYRKDKKMKEKDMIQENYGNEDDMGINFNISDDDFKKLAEENKMITLHECIHATVVEDWEACYEPLKVYFGFTSPEEIQNIDLSAISFRRIMWWFEMMVETGLDCEPEGSPEQLYFHRICDQLINRIPEQLKNAHNNGKNGIGLQPHTLFHNPTLYTEDGQPMVKLSEVAEVVGFDENEFIQYINEVELD